MEIVYFGMFAVIVLFSLLSRRLETSGLTMPMVFLGLGLAAGQAGLHLTMADETVFHIVAEAALAVLLFADAMRIRPSEIRKIGGVTLRMLLIGLPLAILLGFGLNAMLLPGWPVWSLCLLAALLAPTDAALGQAVMNNPAIPERLREVLNAESGLNDGLALPFVVFFACLAVGGTHDQVQVGWVEYVLRQIGLGVLVGVMIGGATGWLLRQSAARGLLGEDMDRVAALATVGAVYFAAEPVIGNSFVAVYCAGAAFGAMVGPRVSAAEHALESQGEFLAIFSFFFIGALFGGAALAQLTLTHVVLIGLSLAVVRPLAVWLSLLGSDVAPRDRLFLGWFGPRGLATALFSIFVVSDFDKLNEGQTLLTVAITAVMVSAVLHGISARFAPRLFGYGEGQDAPS